MASMATWPVKQYGCCCETHTLIKSRGGPQVVRIPPTFWIRQPPPHVRSHMSFFLFPRSWSLASWERADELGLFFWLDTPANQPSVPQPVRQNSMTRVSIPTRIQFCFTRRIYHPVVLRVVPSGARERALTPLRVAHKATATLSSEAVGAAGFT